MRMSLLSAALLCLALASCLGNARKSARSDGRDTVSQQPAQPKADMPAIAHAADAPPAADTTDSDTAQIAASDWEVELKTPVPIDALKPLLDKERQMRSALIAQLERSTPQQADSIYRSDGYFFQNTDEFTALTAKTLALVERAAVYGKLLPGDSVAIRMLRDSGCEIFYLGEGYAELGTGRSYYYDLFKPYLSEATERFAALWTYNDTLLESDAGLIESTDSLYARCLRWEKYMDDYPASVYAPLIGEQYRLYMQNILFCHMDNTPTFEGSWIDDKYVLGKIYDDNLDVIRSLEKTGKGTKTNRIIAQYLDELDKQDYRYCEASEGRIMALCGWIDTPTADRQAHDE